MENFIDNIRRKLFSLIISISILWIVVQMAISGYKYIDKVISGVQLKENIFKEYSQNLHTILNKNDINNSDILKITNYYNRKCNNKFKEVGYSIILEDFYVLNLNERNQSNIFLNNLNNINKLIISLKEKEPYSNLPYKERIVLKNLNLSIKDNNIKRIKDNFQDFKQILEQRYAEYKRIEKEANDNKLISYLSIFLALLSLVIPSIGITKIKNLFQNKQQNNMESLNDKRMIEKTSNKT